MSAHIRPWAGGGALDLDAASLDLRRGAHALPPGLDLGLGAHGDGGYSSWVDAGAPEGRRSAAPGRWGSGSVGGAGGGFAVGGDFLFVSPRQDASALSVRDGGEGGAGGAGDDEGMMDKELARVEAERTKSQASVRSQIQFLMLLSSKEPGGGGGGGGGGGDKSGAGRAGGGVADTTAGTLGYQTLSMLNSDASTLSQVECVCVCVCARARVFVCSCVGVCVAVWLCVRARVGIPARAHPQRDTSVTPSHRAE